MKKYVTLLVLAITVGIVNAQDKYNAGSIPFVDDSVIFSSIEQIENMDAKNIYSLAKMAIADIFVSAKDVIQVEDAENNMFIAKGVTKDGNASWSYTIKFQAKDGRYKIDMYDCQYEAVVPGLSVPPTRYGAEKLTDKNCLDKKGVCKKNGYGYARRFLIDTKDDIFSVLKSKIQKSTIETW